VAIVGFEPRRGNKTGTYVMIFRLYFRTNKLAFYIGICIKYC
jgi:hypothetical protein